MTDESNSLIKDYFVVIPFLGSAIAVSYDVGYFYGIDFRLFTLFSITEHITFALETLPFALVVAAAAMMALRPSPVMVMKATPPSSLLVKVVGWGLLSILVLVLLGVLVYLLAQTSLWGIVLGFIVFCGGLTYLQKNNVSGPYLWASVFGYAIVFAMLFGVDFARITISDDLFTHTIYTTNDTLEIQLIRSGDRGVLVHKPNTNQFMLIRWDDIKRIEFERKEPKR